MLLISHNSQDSPTAKNYLTQSVSSVKVKKLWHGTEKRVTLVFMTDRVMDRGDREEETNTGPTLSVSKVEWDLTG